MISGTVSAPCYQSLSRDVTLLKSVTQDYHVIENLISYNSDHLEALLASNAVHDHVAVDTNEVFAVENSVLVLCGSSQISCL